MGKQMSERIALIMLACILVLMIIPGTFFDMAADAEKTLAGFIISNISLFLVLFLLLMTACYTMFRYVYRKIDRYNEIKVAAPYQQNNTLYICWLIIFICWLPYLIICFPASSFGWDYHWQLLQGMGVVPLSNHHPIVSSLIYGLLYKIGFAVCGAYGGLFFTGLFQTTLMSFAMAYGLLTVRRTGANNKIVRCLLIFICICPVFAGHAVWLIKDSIYSSLIVILLSLCLNYRLDRNKASYPSLIGIVGFFATMYRSEGIIIVFLFYLAAIFDTFREAQKKALKRIIISFISILVLFISFKVGIRVSGIPATSTARESLTIFSAQIIDCVKKHPSDLKEREKEVLLKSYIDLDYAVLKYNEVNRDAIKTIDMNREETMDYLKVWFQIGIRHKGDYIDSFLRGTRGYWWMFRDPKLISHSTPLYATEDDFANTNRREMPVAMNSWLKRTYESYGIEVNVNKTIGELVLENNPDLEGIFYVKSYFPNVRDFLNDFLDRLKKIPLLQFVFVPGFYFFIFILSMGYFFIRKRFYFWQCLPILAIVIVDCFSPINGYMRYFLPAALSSILIVGLCFTGKEDSIN